MQPEEPDDVLEYMKEILPRLEQAEYVHRYGWFSFKETSTPGWSSPLVDSTGKLTSLGESYSNFKGDLLSF